MKREWVELYEAVQHYRFTFNDEAALQRQFAEMLAIEKIPFEREKRLTATERVDFFLWDGMAVEIKVGGSATSHLRQLKRYADCEPVRAVALIGTRLYALPVRLSGKACWCGRVQIL